MKTRVLAGAAALALVTVFASHAGAQGIGSRIKQRVQDKLAERIPELTDSATDAAIERGDASIKCAASNKACVQKVNDAGKQVILTDDKGKPLPNQPKPAGNAGAAATATTTASADAAPPTEPTTAPPPGQGAWLNYDFIPGDRVIFAEDFTGNDVGDFPRRLRLVDGNMEVVKISGQPMLRAADGGQFYIRLPEKLPSRFTVEVRYHNANVNNPLSMATTSSGSERSADFGCYTTQAWVAGNGVGPNSGTSYQSDAPAGFVNCTFTIDNGKGIKGYVDQHRTANAPQDSVVLTDTLYFQVPSGQSADDPALISSIRIAAGGKKLYDVLSEKGRVTTQGIYFDTGSDRIRGESTPTLKEIGDMLSAHPDLKLTIEGHTDNVGVAAANQTLSEKRAAAVKQYLVTTLHVDPARLMSKGLGATKPVAPNTTAEGRQNNRRVELVKM